MATPSGSVCEPCTEAVIEAAMMVGEDYHDEERVAILARTSGGDIFPHECDAEDDEDVECHCGCQRN